MPSVYIHLAGEDIDEAQCILSGMTKVKKEDERLKPQNSKTTQNDSLSIDESHDEMNLLLCRAWLDVIAFALAEIYYVTVFNIAAFSEQLL